jgi:hypothetical protein
VINPKLKTLEAPLIEVMDDASIPPVQDSAKEILSFFCINFFTRFFITKYSFLKP